MKDFLVMMATASGREVEVHTYNDGVTQIRGRLLFKTAAEAEQCATLLREARKVDPPTEEPKR